MRHLRSAFLFASACAAALFLVGVATLFVVLAASTFALAQDTTAVLPYGDWFGLAAHTIQFGLGLAIVWGFRHLPAGAVGYVRMLLSEQLLKRAADYGVNVVARMAAGRSLTVDLHDERIARAVRYVIDHGPAWLVKQLGGEDAIREKIVARIPAADIVPEPALDHAAGPGGS